MRRPTALSAFVVTAVVLAVVVATSLRNAGAQSGGGTAGTLVAYEPVVTLARGDAAVVHVVNLSKDPASPALKFIVDFADAKGMLIGAEQVCEIRAGETCSVTLGSSQCPATLSKGERCEVRALVVGEALPCGDTPDPKTGNGNWSANLEVLDHSGASKYVGGSNDVMTLPPGTNCTGSDGGAAPPPDQSTGGTPDGLPPDLTSPDLLPSPDFTTPDLTAPHS